MLAKRRSSKIPIQLLCQIHIMMSNLEILQFKWPLEDQMPTSQHVTHSLNFSYKYIVLLTHSMTIRLTCGEFNRPHVPSTGPDNGCL